MLVVCSFAAETLPDSFVPTKPAYSVGTLTYAVCSNNVC